MAWFITSKKLCPPDHLHCFTGGVGGKKKIGQGSEKEKKKMPKSPLAKADAAKTKKNIARLQKAALNTSH